MRVRWRRPREVENWRGKDAIWQMGGRWDVVIGVREREKVTVLALYILNARETVQEMHARGIDSTLIHWIENKAGLNMYVFVLCKLLQRFALCRSISWHPFDFGSSSTPSPSAQAVSWSVGSLLSVARPHVPAPLITRASDSLIDRGQFMNIFQPWLMRQQCKGICAQRHGARQDRH